MSIFKTIIPAATVLAIAAMLEACDRKAGADNNIEFETRVDSIGYLMPDYNGDSVYVARKYSVVWPEKIGQQDFDALRDSLLNLTFGDTVSTTFDSAAKKFMTSLTDNMESDSVAPVFTKVPYDVAFDSGNSSIEMINSEVTLLNPQVLVVQVDTYTYYYRAANGMQTERFLNYSIADHKLLTPENTFKPGNETAILDVINAAARDKFREPGTLFDQPIASFDNFQIEEGAMVFVYQPMDIAPHSTGIVKVPVQSYDLYRFLTPLAIKALGMD